MEPVEGGQQRERIKEQLEHVGHVIGEFGSTVKDKIHLVVAEIKVLYKYHLRFVVW